MARALVREPKLLLLDEPLSNLDARLREEMRLEFRDMFAGSGISTLYVTHDLIEALVLSDRIIVMNAGRIVQNGTPRDVYSRPERGFVADFTGAGNMIQGVVETVGYDTMGIRVSFGLLNVPIVEGCQLGSDVLVAIRPEGMTLSHDSSGRLEFGPFVVETDAFLGSYMEYKVSVAEQELTVRMPPTADVFDSGDDVYVQIPTHGCAVIAEASVDTSVG